MRKRLRILILAAIVAALAVPVGFALSLESTRDDMTDMHGITPVAQVTTGMRAPIMARSDAAVVAWPHVPDEARFLAIGTVLFGLAAAMRRTSRQNQHDR